MASGKGLKRDQVDYENAQAIVELVRQLRKNPGDSDIKEKVRLVSGGADPVWQLHEQAKERSRDGQERK